MTTSAKPEGRRQATEDAILDSFESELLSVGARRLNVAGIMARAGFAKPLLYKYFGGIAGLVKAWGERRKFWPDPRPSRSDAAPGDQIKQDLQATATYFRRHPIILEFLAEELSAPDELSKAFGEVRDERGQIELKFIQGESNLLRRENRRLVIVLYAALAYLAMRARRSPRYMGLRLDTDEGWSEAMAMVGEIIDDAVIAARVRDVVAERAT